MDNRKGALNFLKLGLIYQKGLENEFNINQNNYSQNFYKLFIRCNPNYDDYISLVGTNNFQNEMKENTKNFNSVFKYYNHINDVAELWKLKHILMWDEEWLPTLDHHENVLFKKNKIKANK